MNLTTLDRAPVAPVTVTLNRLLAMVGRDTVRLMCAPDGLDVPVRGVCVWDPSMPAAEVIERGDLVLVTGSSDPGCSGPTTAQRRREIAEHAVAAGAAGLVLRADEPMTGLGVAAFTAPADRTWRAVRRELLAALALASADPSGAPGRVPDLHGLAEVTAAALGGPVLVTDGRLRMLAHHCAVEDLDDATRDWIVGRTPPRPVRERLPRAGELLHQWGGGDLTRIARPGGGHWTVAVVRAGGDVLGALWAAGDDETALRLAARRAAVLLVRPAGVQPRQRLHADLLHAALTGADPSSPAALVAAIGQARTPARLLAFRAAGEQPVELLEDLVALRLGTAVVTRVGEHVYATAAAPVDIPALTGIVDRAERAGWAGLRCAVSDPLEDPAELPRTRREVDRLLDLTDCVRPVVTGAEFRGETVLAELTELALARPNLRRGPVRQLAELDRTEDRDFYLPALRAYFDTGLDLQQAADRLYLHRNTLRYRLGRITELTGLDLADPVERLVAELQLRLHDRSPLNHHRTDNEEECTCPRI